jgi:S-layer protein (TIGR01564 family)
MKTIKKIKESSKAVAGTALLVGATLAGGAAFATAQSSGSSGDLGDYPSPFVDDDGEISSTIVMGEDAKATDVVAAANIAGQLGNDAFSSEEVSAGSGSFGWSASDGATLDTRNDQLYFGNPINNVRKTLTSDDLDALSDYEFSDDAGDNTEVEFYLYPGDQDVKYGQDDADEEDPSLKVNNPADPADGNNLFELQANFEDGLNFTHSDVEGEEIELFGKTFTIGESNTASELTLYGNQEEVSIDSGDSSTITVDGEEHTIEVVGVTGSNTAAFRVDGELRQRDDGQTFNVDGQDVRVTDVIQTNSQNSEGVVTFAVGSEELVLTGNNVEDGEGDELEGVTYSVSSDFGDASSITFYVGAQDDDMTFVEAGESYSHSLFENVEFQFGGLNPDASENSDDASEVEFSADGEDVGIVDFEDGDDSASIEFAYANTNDLEGAGDGGGVVELQDSDGDNIATYVGEAVQEDGYLVADQGDFDHMWEVTSIDPEDGQPSDGDEATVDLRDAVTGNSVEVDLTHESGDNAGIYNGDEVIDGQTYTFTVDTGDDNNDDNDEVSLSYGDAYTGYFAPAIDTESGAAVSFMDEATVEDIVSETGATYDVSGSGSDGDVLQTYEVVVPSTESTGTDAITVELRDDGDSNEHDVTIDGNEVISSQGSGTTLGSSTGQDTVNYNGIDYQVTVDTATANTGGTVTDVAVDISASGVSSATAAVIQPEEDTGSGDMERAFTVTPGVHDSDDELDVGAGQATIGLTSGMGTLQTMEDDDDMSADYNNYGTYAEQDDENQGTLTLNIPEGQATAGAAFTAAGGELSGSATGSTVESQTATGWPAQSVALDSDSFVSSAKQDSNLILVGGPAANSLVSELASANKTWETSQYEDGQGLLQMVPDAFNEGHDALVVAGYSGEDTRAAGDFLVNYEQNEDALSGESQVEINTAEGTVVQ